MLFDNLKTALKGTNLIEASAGTGKTYSIATLYLRLLLEEELPVDAILVTTYTDAATAELRERIRSKIQAAAFAFKSPADYLKKEKSDQDELIAYLLGKIDLKRAAVLLENALRNFDEAAIYTIHGFCQRALKDHAFESGSIFNFELLKDQSEIIEAVCNDFWRREIFTAPLLLIEYLQEKKISRDNFIRQFKEIVNKPLLKIYPSKEDILKRKLPSSEKIYRLYNNLKEVWNREKIEIEKFMLNTIGLNQTYYKAQKIPLSMLEMDLYLNTETIFKANDSLKKFSSQFIREKGSNKNFKEQDLKCSFFFKFNEFHQLLKTTLGIFDRYVARLKVEFIAFMQAELVKRKQKVNLRSFDDLLTDLEKALYGKKGSALEYVLRTRYRAAMIDEFQDTDLLQYRIFNKIFNLPGNILFFIGDPKQAIYSFRGADIFAYLKAAHDADQKYLLSKNWRSHKDLVNAINVIFKGEAPFVFKEINYNQAIAAEKDEEYLEIAGDKSAPFKFWFLKPAEDNKKEELPVSRARILINQQIKSEIIKILNLGRAGKAAVISSNLKKEIRPGDIAVLVRTHAEAQELRNLLTENDLPSIIQSRESVFKSLEMNDLYILLQAIAEPSAPEKISAALATDLLGMQAGEINELFQDENHWSEVLLKFQNYYNLWERTSFINMFRKLLVNEGVKPRLVAQKNGSRKVTNVLQLIEIFQKAVVENGLGTKGLLNWISKKILTLDGNEESVLRLETDEDAVRIVTIHASKGLQYPIVFCPFCWKGSLFSGKGKDGSGILFHDKEGAYCIDLEGSKDPEFIKKAEMEMLAENMRLLYVALTRSRYQTYFVWGKIKGAESSAPAYLFNRNSFYAENKKDFDLREFSEYVKNLSWSELYKNLEKHLVLTDAFIELKLFPFEVDNGEIHLPAQNLKEEQLTCRRFKKSISDNWKITSYSWLVSGLHSLSEGRDYYQESAKRKEAAAGEENIFNFPAGSETGLALHEIFEELDFFNCKLEDAGQLVKSVLLKYNFEERWQKTITNMVFDTLKRPLVSEWGNILLKNIKKSALCKELEFYFPLAEIESKKLAECFVNYSDKTGAEFVKRLAALDFSQIKGFLKGFVDLVFEWEGRYYIIDWKSNYLGDSLDDYNLQTINQSMLDHMYYLQYYIYSVALHQYLKTRIKDYSYQNHFGGTFYIYLRGMKKDNLNSGVFTDRPAEDLIDRLTEFLIRK